VVRRYNVAYVPVPKAACTSLKRAMYRLEHGKDFAGEMRNGRKVGIQRAYPTRPFTPAALEGLKDPFTFAVLRDPAERVLSTWSNRVMQRGRLEVENQRKLDRLFAGRWRRLGQRFGLGGQAPSLLNPRPDLNDFVLNIEAYSRSSAAVRHHTRSVADFLGPDLSVYNRLYRVQDMPALEADIRDRTGLDTFAVPRTNVSPPEYRAGIADLSDAAFDKLMTWLEPEYELLSQWFTPPRRDQLNTQQTGTI